MSNQQHPITTPPLVREQWHLESPFKVISLEREDYMIDRAAQWGADQEREASLEWLEQEGYLDACHSLGATRRPKSPRLRLKEQALEALGPEPLPETGPTGDTILNVGTIERHRIVRRALEALYD